MHYQILSDCLLTPDQCFEKATIEIRDGLIINLQQDILLKKKIPTYDLCGKIVLPAFINAHDHFLGTWFPKVGRGNYFNWAQWNADLKSSDTFQERSHTTDEDRYFLGSYKSICSGVTTVSDHIPHEINEPHINKMPMRIHRNYKLSHAVSSMRLDWGDGIEIEYEASKGIAPFITHLNEGFDPDTRDEINELHRLKALQNNTILIHCISMTDDDVELVARQGASMVWCPDSNVFMFNMTANLNLFLQAKVNVSLGTDSCATGSLHLMDELKRAKIIANEWGFSITDKQYLMMVTLNPARALMIDSELGSLAPGKRADILVLDRIDADPYRSATSSMPTNIHLLTMDGKPLMGKVNLRDLFNQTQQLFSTIMIDNSHWLIVGEPMKLLEKVRRAVGFHKELPFLPFA